MPSDFAIVILSYDHVQLTRACVESALRFDKPIVLFHNGSTDKNRDILKKEFPGVIHTGASANHGFASGINLALDFAFGQFQYAFFLTNDCELRRLPESFQNFISVPQIIQSSGRTDSFGGYFDPTRGKLRHVRAELSPRPECKEELFYVPGAAFGLSRDLWEKYGKFDEKLHTYWEDVDWSQRLQRCDIHLDDQCVVLHKGKRTTRRNSFYSLYLFQRNRRWVSRKYCPPRARLGLECLLLVDGVRTIFRLLLRARFRDLPFYLRSFTPDAASGQKSTGT